MPETDAATVLDVIAAVLLILGTMLSAIAGIGLLRFPDQLSRMHAGTKPQVLGLLLMMLALACAWRAWVWVPILVLAWVLQMLTAPVSAHLVGRASYRTKHLHPELLYVDELQDVVTSQDDEGQRSEDAQDQASVPQAGRRDEGSY